LISQHIDKLKNRKSQRELALKMGFKSVNMLSMIKTGHSKVPLEKIPIIAEVLEIDPALLFRTTMRTQWPEMERAVYSVFGGVVTKNERAWLDLLHEIFGDKVPEAPRELHNLKLAIKALKRATKS
jgi:transcriptional regulator with XRE-family HTH domain